MHAWDSHRKQRNQYIHNFHGNEHATENYNHRGYKPLSPESVEETKGTPGTSKPEVKASTATTFKGIKTAKEEIEITGGSFKKNIDSFVRKRNLSLY